MSEHKTITSISGGKSSAYVAANYPTDYNVFSLVTTSDKDCMFPDSRLRQLVSDKIGREFIGTLEDDLIIYTILDLEQFLGKPIDWVAGPTFDDVVDKKGGWLPSKLRRYCTVEMKIKPLFDWWRQNFDAPVITNIGFRSGEERRANSMLERCNKDGVIEQRAVVGHSKTGNRKKWGEVPWQIPSFPMIENGIRRDHVVEFWKDKKVQFAEHNNCVGCFHRNPIMLNLMFEKHPEKMEWFARQEDVKEKGNWRQDTSYRKIQSHKTQLSLDDLDGFNECDSGYCGI